MIPNRNGRRQEATKPRLGKIYVKHMPKRSFLTMVGLVTKILISPMIDSFDGLNAPIYTYYYHHLDNSCLPKMLAAKCLLRICRKLLDFAT